MTSSTKLFDLNFEIDGNLFPIWILRIIFLASVMVTVSVRYNPAEKKKAGSQERNESVIIIFKVIIL